MNLNVSLQSNNFTAIKFTFENFEEAYVDASYIENFDLYTKTFGEDYETVMVIFNTDFAREQKEIIKRLQLAKDVTYIDVICQGVKDVEVIVPYLEDEDGCNLLQNMGEFQNGFMFLEISKELV